MRAGLRIARELALFVAAVAACAALVRAAWVIPEPAPQTFGEALASRVSSLPTCHCGGGGGPMPGRHAYRPFAKTDLLPSGLSPEAFHLYEQRHVRAYVDWWNGDEKQLRLTVQLGEPALQRAMTRMRRSAQSVLLGQVYRDTVLGRPADRRWSSPTLERLRQVAGSGDRLGEHLLAALPPGEGWLVLGLDTAVGDIRLANPDAHASQGLWGGFALAAIDLHRTAHFFDHGADRTAHLATVWSQINCRALEARVQHAHSLIGRDIEISGESLLPLGTEEVADRNRSALVAVRVEVGPETAGSLADAVPEPLRAELGALLGTADWSAIVERWVALTPRWAVLGVVIETGDLVLFHAASDAEGVWGVAPIAAFTPADAEWLAARDWEPVSDRLRRWREVTGGRG